MSDASRIEALADVKIDFVGAGDRHSIAVSDTGVIYTFGSGRAPSTYQLPHARVLVAVRTVI
jgi:alpha-tubulin suppressor-like RCC1 family protein